MSRFPSKGALITLLLLSFNHVFLNNATVNGFPDTTIEDIECKPDTWLPNDPYGTLVEDMLDDLAFNGPDEPQYKYYIDYTDGTVTTYGYSNCNTQLNQEDCMICLADAEENLLAMCSFSMGAEVVMADCRMIYENFPFYD